MHFRLFDVLPIVWYNSACLMYFRQWGVTLAFLITSTCLMYFRLYGVTLDFLITSACFMCFSMFDVLQLTKNLSELCRTKNWYNYFETEPSRNVLPPKIQSFTENYTWHIISLLVSNHHRDRIPMEAKTVLSRKWNQIFPIDLQCSIGWSYKSGKRIV